MSCSRVFFGIPWCREKEMGDALFNRQIACGIASSILQLKNKYKSFIFLIL
jgi:hypothetical protein